MVCIENERCHLFAGQRELELRAAGCGGRMARCRSVSSGSLRILVRSRS